MKPDSLAQVAGAVGAFLKVVSSALKLTNEFNGLALSQSLEQEKYFAILGVAVPPFEDFWRYKTSMPLWKDQTCPRN